MTVSVVMPLFNEEKYIEKCLVSLLEQDYPRDDMEWIFVNGKSTDKTVDILKQYQIEYPGLIQISLNPQKIVPCAMNIGIRQSRGKYIIRLDAHAEYANDYISKCVQYLDTMDADNVGGLADTKARTPRGKTIAKVLSSKFGVGNSRFRTNSSSGYVDTVPFGAFRREIFSELGGYDERLIRNQDNEMNYRIRKSGRKIYLSDDIHFSYYCRDSVSGITRMARQNGMWNIITMKLCPGSMGIRHFIPLLFVMSVILLFIGGFLWKPLWILLGCDVLSYLLLDIYFSVKVKDCLREFLLLLILFPLFHVNYGVGSLAGIVKSFKYKKNGYQPPRI